MMVTVLIVDDEATFRDVLRFNLNRDGYDVLTASNGVQALDVYKKADVILLDLMLPEMSGEDVCRKIRQHSSVPIIMVTAKESEIDKVVGLEIGADDYVTKPYSYRELVARIRAILRRTGAEPATEEPQPITIGRVTIDPVAHVVYVDHQPISMPLREYELLEYLMENAGRVVTRGQILDRIWGIGYVGDSKTLDVHVKRIRSKIEKDPVNPSLLVTVRGVGYKIVTPSA
ncbi:Sensory transduction protein regX3 [Arcanobacterium haemolyticum]|uniref:Sensory transduction protein RegX3 n=2 Tax=Arcanobacterium haemolyticum TaxID=28264 RepID=D7BL19_ARCHD|nr:two component transcriptional regulator, winged helix family [Arcanobacterium haemolyticum DSM 20595]SQH27793.1 Sensory transduction protein regX3 [Arcanobacterium haemolyticum]